MNFLVWSAALCCYIILNAEIIYSQTNLNDESDRYINPISEIKSDDIYKSVYSTKKNLKLTSLIEIPTHSILISTDAGRSDNEQTSQRIQYNPTFGPNLGIRAAYDLLNFSFAKKLSFISQQEIQTYGQSNYDDFRLGFNFSKYINVETYYQNYRGFYTDLSGQEGLQTTFNSNNSGNSAPSANNSSKQIISRPDMTALNYGVRTIFTLPLVPIFNAFSTDTNKYSAIDSLKNEPFNWDFNFLTKIYYNRLAITADQPLVPASKANSISPIASLKEHWANTLGVGAGLGVVLSTSNSITWGFDAILGAGFQRQTNVFTDHESVGYTTAQELNSNFFIDWKKLNHGFHFGVYWDTFSSKVDNINFDNSSLGLNLAYSYSGLYF